MSISLESPVAVLFRYDWLNHSIFPRVSFSLSRSKGE